MHVLNKQFSVRVLSILLFVVLTASGLIFSIYLIYNATTLYTLVMAVLFLMLAFISGFFNMASSYWYYKSYFYNDYITEVRSKLKPLTKFPTVAVAMATFNEDTELVKKDMLRLKELNYPKDKIKFYILDDSPDTTIAADLKAFSAANDVIYMHRDNREGYKAGALNNMLKHSKEEFIAIFDYDEYLTDFNFLLDIIPFFHDKRMSYIQTTKQYAAGTLFSDTINLFDAYFFKFIEPARSLNNTAVFAGSCGVIRRSSLDAVGGFPEYIIEDTFFSFESDINNFKSLYVPKVYAYGKPILTFSELARQQWRYNYGDTQFISYFINRKRDGGHLKTLSHLSNMDYVMHGFGFNYLSIVIMLFTLTSILVVFSSIPITHLSLSQILSPTYLNFDLEVFGISAFLVSFMTPIVLTRIYFGSATKGFMIFLINFSLAFIRAKAALTAIFNIKPRTGWIRSKLSTGSKFFTAIKKSSIEIAFSIMLFILGIVALIIDNFSGGMLLLWYGVLYSSTFYFFYKYG